MSGVRGASPDEQATTDAESASARLRVLRDLCSASITSSGTADTVCRSAALALRNSEIPFALFYLLNEDGTRLRLVASVGLMGSEIPTALAEMDAGSTRWNSACVLRTGQREVVQLTPSESLTSPSRQLVNERRFCPWSEHCTWHPSVRHPQPRGVR